MTGYRLAVPAVGLPASSPRHGSLGWSSAAVLIGDPDVVLIDTGGPGYRARWDDWLGELGLSRLDVTVVLLTHAHWDHLGAASWFPRAAIGIGRHELDWAAGAADRDPYVEPALLAGVRHSSRLHTLDEGDTVAGVRVVATPGHTPGHLSYAATTADGPVLVVGDAIKNGPELAGADFALTADPVASVASRARIHRFAAEGHRLLLGHDGLYDADLRAVPVLDHRIRVHARVGLTVTRCA